jgi:hypothetical protein
VNQAVVVVFAVTRSTVLRDLRCVTVVLKIGLRGIVPKRATLIRIVFATWGARRSEDARNAA